MSGYIFEDDLGDTDEELEVDPESIANVVALSNSQIKLQKEIEELESEVSEKNKILTDLRINKIPSAMNEISPDGSLTELKFKLDDDNYYTISIAEEISVSIAKKKPFVIGWLKKVGLDEMITTSVSVNFKKGAFDKALRLFNVLFSKRYPVRIEPDVNSGTFKSVIKNLLKDPEFKHDIPLKKLGVNIVKISKVKKEK